MNRRIKLAAAIAFSLPLFSYADNQTEVTEDNPRSKPTSASMTGPIPSLSPRKTRWAM